MTPRDQLMEILAAGDPADAAWAFEKLKDLSYDDLEYLFPYLESERPTPLACMAASFGGPVHCWGSTYASPDLSRVAQFVLSTRLKGNVVLREPGLGLVSRWREELEKFLTSHTVKECAWPGEPRGFLLLIPRVVPPSMDPAMAHLASTHDVEGLLGVLKAGESRVQAMWAVEVLTRLPDERLDLLLPHLNATEMVPVSCVTYLTPLGIKRETCPGGQPLGVIVRCLLWRRLVHPVSAVWTPDPVCWSDKRARPGTVQKIRAAWLAHRTSMPLEAGTR